MNTEKVQIAILSAISLISEEAQSLCNDDLTEEYNQVLEGLYEALEELKCK